MKKRFRFTNDKIRALPPNPPDARGTDLEFSDTDVMGLKCLVGKSGNKRWLLRYRSPSGKRRSIALGRFPDMDVALVRKATRKLSSYVSSFMLPITDNPPSPLPYSSSGQPPEASGHVAR
ncbi:Arm DNA-binding domain-containing protein [Oceanospirillum linum]|uniref:Integrase DNA-binding domain-containing protein n=1 Tax=Oceanospirillum linum TaxID=966 RepID=A0A1T1HFR4_OCELI|nr:Arm DNA-binding domain-containing protein [Oceanospirillum linum]OOV88688.1 hypothetical protein BTA35_0204205 [Oceanospirillum linum]SEG02706.1 protein of unknown function [Oleiphilus messinensis]SMP21525.1 protein of unknown function [Oceanospirillum linum]